MSTVTPTPKGKPKKARPVGLPDEKFWIKYSPHHELPLSVTSSIFIHAVAFGMIGLILAGILSGLFGGKHQADVKPFQLAGGGGGDPNGNADANNGALPSGNEVKETTKTEPIQPVEATKTLNTPDKKTEPLVNDPKDVIQRLMEEPVLSQKNMGDIATKANAKVAAAIAKGGGGPGTGGGIGKGKGRVLEMNPVLVQVKARSPMSVSFAGR